MTALLETPPVARPDALSLADLGALVRSVAGDASLWQHRLRIPAEGEDRWWTRLSSDRRVDLWLLSWRPGQETELHDHGHSAAAFFVVRGQLDEDRAERTGRPVTHRRAAGSLALIAPGVMHDVRGAGDAPAVSIHAYSPPLEQMTYYRSAATGLHAVRTVLTSEPESTK